MLNTLLITTVVIALSVTITGCSQKVVIRALEPAEIDRAALTKKVSVAPFENDRFGISNKIEANLAKQKIDDKEYFTVISRKDFDKIIAEQKIQNSGLVDVATALDVGNLIGAQAIISGRVGHATSKDRYFYEERLRCLDKKCKESIKYRVSCTKRAVGLSAEIRMVDISKGDIIYADTLNKTSEYKQCQDSTDGLPTSEAASGLLANRIANDFTYKLLPHYRYFEVVLLDDPDIEYSSHEDKLLESSLEYIKQNRLDKAEKLLVDLIDSTQQKSYVPFYNLGVIKEAQGAYGEAQKYYKMADDLVVEPVVEVSTAYVRIGDMIEKHKKAKEQLSK
jgi:curli biogenesis system outer membrane secretion channel CsgG